MGIKEKLKEWKERKQKFREYEKEQQFLNQFEEKKKDANERELEKYLEEDRKKAIKQELERRRFEQQRRNWSGRENNALYIPNIISNHKKLFTNNTNIFTRQQSRRRDINKYRQNLFYRREE